MRPDWDEYFLDLVAAVSVRSTCDRGKTACVVVKDRRIVATGYAGSPPGLAHCDDEGHLLRTITYEDGQQKTSCVRTIHAEQNAICQAARFGLSLEGATVYAKMEPCRVCAMLIIAAGIKRVVALRLYEAGRDAREMFKVSGVEFEVKINETEFYEANVLGLI